MIFTNVVIDSQNPNKNKVDKVASIKIPSLGDLLFDTVTIIPEIINIGTISSVYTFDIQITNTTLSTVTITDISTVNGEGFQISLSEGSMTITPGGFSVFEVKVSPEGSSTIEAKVVFEFNNEEDNVVFCEVNGSRVALFGYDIDYSQPINEYYKHNTLITTSNNGSELRSSISQNPRMSFDYYYTFTDSESRQVQNMIYQSQMKEIQVPIFQLKGRTLTESNSGDESIEVFNLYLNIEAGMSLMIKNGSEYEVLEILNINGNTITFSSKISNSYPSGTPVFPIMDCLINNSFMSEYKTNNLFNTLVTFDVIDNKYKNILSTRDADIPTYKNEYVLLRNPSRDVTFRRTNIRQYDSIDNGYGVRTRDVNDNSPAITMTYVISLYGKEEINKFKVMFNKSKGRYRDFYATSSTNDFVASGDIISGSSSLKVINDGQSMYNENANFKDLCILLKNGEYIYKEITSIDSEDEGNLLVNFLNDFTQDISKEEIGSIQFLSKARFNNDTLQISHLTDEYAEVTIDINIFRGK